MRLFMLVTHTHTHTSTSALINKGSKNRRALDLQKSPHLIYNDRISHSVSFIASQGGALHQWHKELDEEGGAQLG